MTTKLESVVLSGIYKNEPVVVRFDRYKRSDCARSIGWTLSVSIKGKCHRFTLKDRDVKPCWSVAIRFMDVQNIIDVQQRQASQSSPKKSSGFKVFK